MSWELVMAQNSVSQVVSNLRALGQLSLKNYALKVDTILEISVNIANFLILIFYTKMSHYHQTKMCGYP